MGSRSSRRHQFPLKVEILLNQCQRQQQDQEWEQEPDQEQKQVQEGEQEGEQEEEQEGETMRAVAKKKQMRDILSLRSASQQV